jgi:hypothetical protein
MIKRVRENQAYWIKELYDAMADTSNLRDKPTSAHRKRFECVQFQPKDVEAACYKIFDRTLEVHTKGWTRPTIYLKEAVRGKNVDRAKTNAAMRMRLVVETLRESKASCNDVIQGGLPLSKLCYNPMQHISAKIGNDIANGVRARRIQVGTRVMTEEEQRANMNNNDGNNDETTENQTTENQVIGNQATEVQVVEETIESDDEDIELDDEDNELDDENNGRDNEDNGLDDELMQELFEDDDETDE